MDRYRRRISALDAARLYTMRWQGDKVETIAAELGYPISTVQKMCYALGLSARAMRRCGRPVDARCFNRTARMEDAA